jgi:Asp-tRNA(Asn)/Glu-tRNA(Gln) amidotransferase C subunit
MPTDENIRKLCNLARLEIENSEFEKTSGKIKETLEFFGKLDEFKIDLEEQSGSNNVVETPTAGSLRIEKSFDELREDIPRPRLSDSGDNSNLCDDITTSTSTSTSTLDVPETATKRYENNSFFDSFNNFAFLNTKRGYVIGPRI